MQVSYKFKKLFVNLFAALLCFVYFNAHAEPITGAFGLKLGEHLPNWVEGESKAVLTDFKDDFFDTVEYLVLPYTKRLYWIRAQKNEETNFCYKVRDALISVLRDKYSEYEIKPEWSGHDFEAKDGDRKISLSCGKALRDSGYSLQLTYEVEPLVSEFFKEQTLLEKRKIDGSKL